MASESTISFRLSYDGDALAENTMDVRDLAPALIAFGELFDRANQILNGDKLTVNLKVRATKPGSFELLLILAQSFLTATQFLSSDLVVSAANLVGLITGVPKIGESLFRTFKKLKGNKPEIIQQDNGVTLRASNVELQISNEVFRLYQDSEIKRLSQAVVEPLFRPGIDEMIIKDNRRKLESVNKEEAPSFNYSGISDANTSENIIPILALRLVSPTFDEKKMKWRLDDGSGAKWYGIEDDNFLQKVRERKMRFGMGDYLICRVRHVQHVTENGLEMERTILTVLEHKIGGEQLSFDTLKSKDHP
jgi:hypothetical protein